MTSDAKIGLLLGLVFIFVIAFVINGLPFFRNAAGNSSELTTNMVSSTDGSLGIGPRTRDLTEVFGGPSPLDVQSATRTPEPEPQQVIHEVRAVIPIPENITNPSGEAQTIVTEQQNEPVAETPPAREILEVAAPEPARPEPARPQPVKRVAAKIYEVADGDNLASIAKKFYGEDEGNKMANIEKIFKANRAVMKSIDKLDIGQKLVIPQLDSETNDGFFSSLFERVNGIGSRRAATESRSTAPEKRYVVKDGDNLWRIAATQLGDGNRHEEIFKLNRDILKNKSSLSIGMSLRMPR